MRALILVERGVQDEEFIYPYYRMLEAGWKVEVATPNGTDVHGKFGVPVRATCTILRALKLATENDVILIPGGFECPDRLRSMLTVQTIVRDHFYAGKLIAAICHGPWVLISAGIVKGKNMAGYESIADDLKNAGAIYSDAAVVTDGNIITADHYRSLGPFMKTVIEWRKEPAWGLELCGAAARP